MKNQIFELSLTHNGKNGKAKDELSERETEVLQLAADGLSNKCIAHQLCLTDDTIDTHNRSVVAKLKANNMKQAVAIGIRNKLIK